VTKKQIQKYQSGFKSKREAREAYSKLMLTKPEDFAEQEQKDELTLKEFISGRFSAVVQNASERKNLRQ
jgi:hypothetical protein